LSDRELRVLQELTHGKSTKEVAENMHISEETVKTYLKQIFRKLDVRDRTEAVAEAFRRGLVH
jgi:DNA-binding NarL/FixJ family response regulator